MKKTPRKIGLRSETLRMLANMDLAGVAGGFGSGDEQRLIAFESVAKQWESRAAL